jgi:hypothetical protein
MSTVCADWNLAMYTGNGLARRLRLEYPYPSIRKAACLRLLESIS